MSALPRVSLIFLNAPFARRPRSGYFDFYMETGKDCVSEEMDYNNGFPEIFFDMTNEEITAYLQTEKEKDDLKLQKKEAKEKERKEKAKTKKAELISSAKSKLIPQELKALRIK